MNESDNRERIKILAAGFVIDDLDDDEEREFRQLLAQNPELAREVDDLQNVFGQVLHEFTDVGVPSSLLPQILTQVEAETQKESVFEPKVIKSPNHWKKVAAVLATLSIVVLGIDNYRLRHNFALATRENQRLAQEFSQIKKVNSLLQEYETKMVSFQGKDSMDKASGSMLINRQKQKALMTIKNLPPPPDGHYYLLWAIVQDQKLPCGQIKPYVWENSVSEVPFTPEMARDFYNPKFVGLFVTLETDKNVSSPTGPVIMESKEI